ncbi:uncharacterized protein AAES06_015745 isoform 2-T2 [Glossophaga mutica]
MGSWWLLLLLLFIGDGALNLPGIVTTCGCESAITTSTPKETTLCSDASSALPNSQRDNAPTVPLNTSVATRRAAMAEAQMHTTPATISTSPPAYNSARSTEWATAMRNPLKEILRTANITTSKGRMLSNSMVTATLKEQGRTASSTMATSDETSEQNQRASAAAPLAPNPTVNILEALMFIGSQKSSTLRAPTVLNTPSNGITSPVSMATTISKKSISPTTLNKITDVKGSPPMATSTVTHTTSLTLTSPGAAVLGTTTSGTQEGETTAAQPLTPTIAPTMGVLSETRHSITTQTPSGAAESAPSAGPATAQSPEIIAVHSTALIPSSSGTTKSSAMTGAGQASPKRTQTPSSGAGACASDEFLDSRGVCMCNDSYYAHSELSGVLVALHCKPQKIEVVLSTCFLKTHYWILREGPFSGCSNVSQIEEGRRAQVFRMEKKEGACGLRLSTNSSHALYSLEEQLLQDLPDFTTSNSTMLSLSCVYPLVVNVSQTHPYPVTSFPYSTIHVPGIGDTIVILGIFTDPELSSPLENKPSPLGKPLYVVLRATSSDPDRFALVANEVFTSTSISMTGAAKATYHFVKESCPVSHRLLWGLRDNGASLEVTLAFRLFRLNSDMLYLHGRVTLCDKQAGRPCQPTCSQKNPPANNGAWAPTHSESGVGRIVFGPIRISGAWMAIFLLMVMGWIEG